MSMKLINPEFQVSKSKNKKVIKVCFGTRSSGTLCMIIGHHQLSSTISVSSLTEIEIDSQHTLSLLSNLLNLKKIIFNLFTKLIYCSHILWQSGTIAETSVVYE